jgi:recombinational DNA repair protein (RecF pathway)
MSVPILDSSKCFDCHAELKPTEVLILEGRLLCEPCYEARLAPKEKKRGKKKKG